MATSVNTATATSTPTKMRTTTFCLLQRNNTMHEWAFDCHLIEYPMRTSAPTDTITIVRTTFSSPFTSGWQKHKCKHRQQNTHKKKQKRKQNGTQLIKYCRINVLYLSIFKRVRAQSRATATKFNLCFGSWTSFISRSEFLTFSFPLNNSVRKKSTN